jgi:TolA-binding protein
MRPPIQTETHGPPWHDLPPSSEPQPAPRRPRRKVSRRTVARTAVLVCGLVALRHAGEVRTRIADLRRGDAAPAATQPLEPLLEAIEAAEQSGDTAAIERLCSEVVAAHPDHPVAEPALLRLVQARLMLGDERRALHALHDMRARFPASRLLPAAFFDVAAWQYRNAAFLDAAGSYTDLVALVTSGDGRAAVTEDTAPEPIIWRSKALWMEHKRAERGRTELERLARFNQALCYEQAGDRESALRAYERFLSRFPQDAHVPEARFRMATLLEAEARTDEAARAYQAVHEDALAPVAFRCESMYRLGRLHQAARRFDAAIAVYREVLPLRPADNGFRLAAMGELAALLESRDRELALTIYRELSASGAPAEVRAGALQRLAALGAKPAAGAID